MAQSAQRVKERRLVAKLNARLRRQRLRELQQDAVALRDRAAMRRKLETKKANRVHQESYAKRYMAVLEADEKAGGYYSGYLAAKAAKAAKAGA